MKSHLAVTRTDRRRRLLGAGQDSPSRKGDSTSARARLALTAIIVASAIALTAARALAQQPVATPTPAPRNPNWCSDVPASPAPPSYDARNRPGAWAAIRRRCINEVGVDSTCMYECQGARELWQRATTGGLNQPLTLPPATNQLQGPLPLQGGAKGYILPAQPVPAPGGPTSNATDGPSISQNSFCAVESNPRRHPRHSRKQRKSS